MKIWIVLILCCTILLNSPIFSDSLDEAQALYSKGDFAGAIRIYQAASEQNPKSEKARVGLIRSLLKNEEIADAQALAEKAIELFPESASVHVAMGDVLFRMARISESRKAYSRALELDPRCARGYWGLSNIHFLEFDRKTAGALKKKAYECDPEDLEILSDYSLYLPVKEQIPLLQKYLRQATRETEDKRNSVEDESAFLKASAELKGELRNPPATAVIPMERIQHTPTKPASGYLVKVRVNKKKTIDLQLDTGAGGIIISRRLAEKLTLGRISRRRIKGIGDSGTQDGYTALAQSIQIGPLDYNNFPVTVVEKGLPADADGIIGPSIMGRYLVKLNFPQNRIELNPLPWINGKPFANPDTWNELDRTKCPELASYQAVAGWGYLLIPVSVNNKKSGYFILDTGGAVNLLSREFASGITGLRDIGNVLRGISGGVKTFEATDDITLRIGRFTQTQKSMYVVSLKEISRNRRFEISGLLGDPFLSNLAVTIDYRDGYIHFEYQGKP
jgi:tetratricopeptide (TPR) repeat protein